MRGRLSSGGWRGAILVAMVYVYFLIFAQFAFLGRLQAWGVAGDGLKAAMAAMAAGGILLSLMTPRVRVLAAVGLRLRIGLAAAAGAAFLALLTLGFAASLAVSFLIGASLGMVTVTLVTHLRSWCGGRETILKGGLGVGLGYLLCNIPIVFHATAERQTLLAALLSTGAALLPLHVPEPVEDLGEDRSLAEAHLPFPFVLAAFTALIWLDSAAFYIIQHTAALKADTWTDDARLWMNAGVHFLVAIASALLLRRGRLVIVVCGAFAALAMACALLAHAGLSASAALFYPAGVSLYSVALVAYPSSLAVWGTAEERGRLAGWLYAVAGWGGSALGIGMGQNLGYVPMGFVAAAGLVAFGPLLVRLAWQMTREMALLAGALLTGAVLYHVLPADRTVHAGSAVERGRQVYVAEGCISCHSQFVRPATSDALLWGPASTAAEIHRQKPPLIGNRRQGPDLAEVGARRSPLWLKAHLIAPDVVSSGSIMPSYAFLFDGERGNDLVAYLASLQNPETTVHEAEVTLWQPAEAATRTATSAEGRELYMKDCATCHEQNGAMRMRWGAQFGKQPADLAALQTEAAQRNPVVLAQIVKFGMRSTDMPGHEWLSDRQVASLSLLLRSNTTKTLAYR